MARHASPDFDRPPSTAFAALLAWVLPGLGHWWIGERARGVIFFIVINATFWGGVAVSGLRSTVQPRENGAWIAAQLCAGPQAFAALHLSNRMKQQPDEQLRKAMWPAATIGVVYVGVAGLLNLLVIVDVLARVEAVRSLIGPRPSPRSEDR
ncbi:MAG: hypothetical protein KJ749_06030 [Planctomycetes bacterium]|nr:hypothetical protein [Planctomycetota bacterium]